MRTRKRKRTERRYSYFEFLVLFDVCSEQHRKELTDALKEASCPRFFNKTEVPESLNHISYGTLDDLRCASECDDPIAEMMNVLLGMSKAQVYKSNVVDVFGFSNFVKDELTRINKLFSSLKVQYSPEEIAAGVKDLDFGSFGVLDWYAKRMGITSQNDVRDVAWVRIYNCMRNDIEQNNYERRLNKQYLKKK